VGGPVGLGPRGVQGVSPQREGTAIGQRRQAREQKVTPREAKVESFLLERGLDRQAQV